MDDLTFEYKGRKLFIHIQKSSISPEVTFLLCDFTDIEKESLDFSEKELTKIEILDYLKNDAQKDFEKTIVASKTISLNEFLTFDSHIRLAEIRKELLKEYDNV